MRRTSGVALALAVVLVAACGVQDDSSPRALPEEEILTGLLAPATSAADAGSGEGARATVWLVDNDGLLARGSRRALEPPITVEKVLGALLAGVTDAEAGDGLVSNITADTKLLDVEGPENGLVTVDLSLEFLNVSREVQRLALAQVVFTATGLSNVDRVLFKFAGERREVPGRGDELTKEPLTRADFAQFDPSATTTSSTTTATTVP